MNDPHKSDRAQLKQHVLISSLWSLGGSAGQQLVSFFLFIYLARQLSPADVGMIAIAMIVIELLGFVTRLGQVETLQREAAYQADVATTSFWLLVATGSGGFVLILAAAGLSELLGNHLLAQLLAILSPLSILQCLSAVPEALLKQRMAFRPLTFRTWGATLAGGGVAIVMVHAGMGVYSLAGQRLATSVVATIAVWLGAKWRPERRFYRDKARDLVRTGSAIMGATLSGVLNARITDTVTAAALGPSALGFLRLGNRFSEVLAQVAIVPISSVALTSFSRLRDDYAALIRAYLRLTQFMALGALPAFFGLSAVADVFVPLVFGPKWSPAVIVFQLLPLPIISGAVNYFFAPVMNAIGKTRELLTQSLVQIAISIPLVWLGAQFGVAGVMIAYAARATLVGVYNIIALERRVGMAPTAIIGALAPPLICCLGMYAVVRVAVTPLTAAAGGWVALSLLVLLGAVTYGALLVLGDVLRLWPGYLAGALRALGEATGRKARR